MEKEKEFTDARFSPEVISSAFEELLDIASRREDSQISIRIESLSVTWDDYTWQHDNDAEFFADYDKPGMIGARYSKSISYNAQAISVVVYGRRTIISVKADMREHVEEVFRIFEDKLNESQLTPVKKENKSTKIFLGHGGDRQWRDLKDHLQDKHDYLIEAYEVGARAGHEIRDVLESMMVESSFAIIVMTGEDEGVGGKLYPRGNVVHELGLFQGRLGFNKVIVLLEEGTETFSNINGVTQIRYAKGQIKETFGDVLATLKRDQRV